MGSVFITGARGFIGTALARRYRAAGAEVRGMDRSADPQRGIVAGDVRRPGDWQRHAEGCELFIHTAAIVSLRLEGAREVWEVNVGGTRQALDAAVRAGARRFIHFSSVVVFGLEFRDGVDESEPLALTGIPYADTKMLSEHHVLQAHAAGRIAATIVRPGDVYGPGSRAWAVIPTELIEARRFLLPDGGRGIFSPVYIDNLIDGVVLAAESPAASGEVVTITDGRGIPNREFFAPYAELVGRRLLTAPAPLAKAAAWAVQRGARLSAGDNDVNPAAVRYMCRSGTYSIAKARRLLGYEPAVGLEEGQRRTLAWLRERRGGGRSPGTRPKAPVPTRRHG